MDPGKPYVINAKYLVLGVDPGLDGGLAFVRGSPGERPQIISGLRMPTIADPAHTFTSSNRMVHGEEIARYVAKFVGAHGSDPSAIIERAAQLPQTRHRAGMFNFGFSYGVVFMAVSLGIGRTVAGMEHGSQHVHTVAPTVWKRELGLSKDKEKSRELATLIFETDRYWKAKIEEGIAEAALIAYWRLNRLCSSYDGRTGRGPHTSPGGEK